MSNWKNFNKPITIQQALSNGTATRLPTGSRIRTPASSIQQSMDTANAANEGRYNEAKGIYDTMLSNASGFGQLENQRLNQSVLSQSSNLDQDLFSKGLGNTTIGPSMQAGIQREANFNRTAIADSVARQKNSILEGKAGVIERRQDLGPDLNLFSELQRLAAGAPRQSAAGGGGGGNAGAVGGQSNYKPSIFGGGFRSPQRSNSISSAIGPRRAPLTAHQSQGMIQRSMADPQREAEAEEYRLKVEAARDRQQQAIKEAQAAEAAAQARTQAMIDEHYRLQQEADAERYYGESQAVDWMRRPPSSRY